MKILISTILMLTISLSGTVFGIQEAPGDTIQSEILTEADTLIEKKSETIEEPEEGISDISTDENKKSGLPTEIITDQFDKNMERTFKLATSNLPELDMSFTSPVFKIIILSVAIVIILLLLLALSKKQILHTKYLRKIKI